MTIDQERLLSTKTVGILLPPLSPGIKVVIWPVGFSSVFQINNHTGEYVPGEQGLAFIEDGVLCLHAPDIKDGCVLIVQVMEAQNETRSTVKIVSENTHTFAFRFENGVWQSLSIGTAHTIGPAINVVVNSLSF